MKLLLCAAFLLAAALAALPAQASEPPSSPCVNGIAGWQCSVAAQGCRAAVGFYTPTDTAYAFLSCPPASPVGSCWAYADTELDQALNCSPARGP